MSTTLREPGAISPKFSENIGLDETLTLNRTPVRWSTTVVPGQVNPFSLRLPLSTPYDYFRGNGNLLIDIKVFGGVIKSG